MATKPNSAGTSAAAAARAAKSPKSPADNADMQATRLPPFLHPRAVGAVVGHGAAVETFSAAVASGRVHHAWMLCGERGIGKATLAYRFAEMLISNSSELVSAGSQDAAVAMIRQGKHPAVREVTRTANASGKLSGEIRVDDVRELRGYLSTKVARGSWRVCVIDAADEMNINAANAVLKLLEEPPAGCVFFLIAHIPGRVVTTIRSRCRVLRLGRLSDDEVTEVLAARRADLPASAIAAPEWLAKLARQCAGSGQGDAGLGAGAVDEPQHDGSELAFAGGSARRALILRQLGAAPMIEVARCAAAGNMPELARFTLIKRLASPANQPYYACFVECLLAALEREVSALAVAGGRGERLASAGANATAQRLEKLYCARADIIEVTASETGLHIDRMQVLWRIFDTLVGIGR